MARKEHRFKESFLGSIKTPNHSYPCQVKDISQRGLSLLSNAPVSIGDQVVVKLQISQESWISFLIEIRQVTQDGLRAEIVNIVGADLSLLEGQLENLCAVAKQAKADVYRRADLDKDFQDMRTGFFPNSLTSRLAIAGAAMAFVAVGARHAYKIIRARR